MASFVSSTQRGIRMCLASGWSDTGSVLSVEARKALTCNVSSQRRNVILTSIPCAGTTTLHLRMVAMGDPLDLSYPQLTDI